ncbi:class I SAM-dependent methyltransferase [Nocardia mexicana]|uniref:class I SAM-dependent methyltransferase n=1 Tax=Nocardia mexicana TaxID=279262 RepID=UPI001FE7DB86|nr:class I SAM-dependent methyltransferase [Nocardia mexicana]
MTGVEDVQRTRAAYDGVAELYAEISAGVMAAQPLDRAMFGVFAELAQGRGTVADIGCGPGRVTIHLDGLGLDVFGLDLSPEMIRLARAAHPNLRFEIGSMERLDLPDASLGAILAWYSMIHTPPERVPGIVAEFGRVLTDGAPLLLGFQAADDEFHDIQPYDHKVAPVYRWSLRRMAEVLAGGGFETVAQLRRAPDPDGRCPHGCLLARKSATPAG